MSREFNNECKDGINQYNYGFDDKMKYKIIDNLKESINIDKIKTVLEVGCFEGSMTQLLNNYAFDIDVIEPSTDCINKVKEKFPKIQFINTLLNDYNTDKKYDLIIISHTLEHIEDQVAALKKANSLLNKDGYLYVIVPNGTSISRLIANELGVIEYPCCVTSGEKEHGHYITYDLYTLERHFREANLNIFKKGGIVLKIFGNRQYEEAFKHNIIDDHFIDACYELGKSRPLDCASIFIIGN